MERQAGYDLLRCFLEKRGALDKELGRELAGLLAYGTAKGCFHDPNTVFDEGEWHKFGDKLWEATLADEKAVKRLGNHWRTVVKSLQCHVAEQRAALAASSRLGGLVAQNGEGAARAVPQCPLPPATNTIFVPMEGTTAGSAPAEPAPLAPPLSHPPPVSPPQNAPPPPWEPSFWAPRGEREKVERGESGKLIVAGRWEMWKNLADQALAAGEPELANEMLEAFLVTYTPAPGGFTNITNLGWKFLAQLRSTVNDSGVSSEPVRQMLDYIWMGNILLPADMKSLMQLILILHQQLLSNAYWQATCQATLATVRQSGDPLFGVTLEELLGLGAYMRVEAQALLGPDKLRESMRLARTVLNKIKSRGGTPSYMGIKQGREETSGNFIDRVMNAIQAAGVPEYMQGALLKRCALQNCNATARGIIVTMPDDWTIEELLNRMSQVPTGPQAMLVNAVQELGRSMKEQAAAVQSQVLAALAPLQASANKSGKKGTAKYKCFRCGATGHMRRDCPSGPVRCQKCRNDSHTTAACRRSSGNWGSSAKGPRAQTQMAVRNPDTLPAQAQPVYGPPPAEASAWTWQHQ
ncbi:GAK9 protein, partial [Nothoprocta pentlandii]|nr:GAK9 protein [Nothoprocta pentlandii]